MAVIFRHSIRYKVFNQSTYPSPLTTEGENWLDDTEEQMQAEDAMWGAVQAHHADKFASLAAAVRAEIEAGTTQPMFSADGELILP